MNDNFKYDVAFSFCQEDENLANEISEFLSSNFNIFIYSDRQKELVGTDGEIEFKKTFSEYSRIVIVLYRKKYGTTTWTRIEEEAIRGRAYDEGYDFSLYIPLDEDKSTPNYLPKTRIWFNIERFGIEGAANIISHLINERGGDSRPESSKEKAEKIRNKLNFKNKLKYYRESHEGVESAVNEIELLLKGIEKKTNEVFVGLNCGFKSEYQKWGKVNYEDIFLQFWWTHHWANSLEKSSLEVTIEKYRRARNPLEQPRPYHLKKHTYDFEKNLNWENIWKLKNGQNSNIYYKTDVLIEKHLSEFLTIIEKEKIE